jgi:hypothetical protein
MEQEILQLIDELKSLAPALWEVLVRQVYTEAWMQVVGAVVQLLFSGAMAWAAKAVYEQRDDEDLSFWGFAIFAITSIGSLVVAFGWSIPNAAKMFYNPNYYAIKMIIDVLP